QVPVGADRRWAEASMAGYGCGLQVEPFVAIEAEFALHSWLGQDGRCLTGRPTRLVTDANGAWVGSEVCGGETAELAASELRQLEGAHAIAARALGAAGYFGPFSTDAFRWRDERGQLHFNPLGELNARYTMGYFAGLGDRQAQWLAMIGG
ncbi:MAG: hypothetical protein KDC98_07035, partial [Planctomycetes bacterium]|nr:hypothetical protein [Planctomycetota bacterium]